MISGAMPQDPGPEVARRQHWMAVLARMTAAELADLSDGHAPLPAYEVLKAPETGTVMIEGRAGGTGRRFNAGEATMTRCVVRLATGEMGFAYALGRDRVRAERAAVIEALLQCDAGAALHQGIADVARRQAEARALASRKAAATKVEFFTLVRGEG